MNTMKVFLADDHALLRDGVKAIIAGDPRYEVAGESGDGREALERIEAMKPDIAVIDISIPTMSGVEIARQLKKFHPAIRVLMLSQHDNEEYVRELMAIGVEGYILKSNASDELLRALDAIMDGNTFLSPQITTRLVSGMRESGRAAATAEIQSSFRLLSNREREILKLIAEGKSNREIASLLFISAETVKTHRASIMKKLGLKSIAEVVRYAVKEGLVEP